MVRSEVAHYLGLLHVRTKNRGPNLAIGVVWCLSQRRDPTSVTTPGVLDCVRSTPREGHIGVSRVITVITSLVAQHYPGEKLCESPLGSVFSKSLPCALLLINLAVPSECRLIAQSSLHVYRRVCSSQQARITIAGSRTHRIDVLDRKRPDRTPPSSWTAQGHMSPIRHSQDASPDDALPHISVSVA
ncbi:hypothetical protein E2C01_013320 [Portunus trituberculatus]|uniref:Uncharacterized protein n=1 Tax=Portunus trituberculatus TaxID=210409 RepID=A0A5B7DGB4_PORTR|nr:hypothetical protein [Portunus trituberculatus]